MLGRDDICTYMNDSGYSDDKQTKLCADKNMSYSHSMHKLFAKAVFGQRLFQADKMSTESTPKTSSMETGH